MSSTFFGEAYGRVNLIGEHTDYNGGWVLPTAIPQSTRVQLTVQPGNEIEVKSSYDPHAKSDRHFKYTLGAEKKLGDWTDYIQGVTSVLAQSGEKFTGFTVGIKSTVPEGSGLSSSAALEIALMRAIRDAFRLHLTDVDLARLGQRVENEFVGARVGIMDQMACGLARPGEALYLDTQELTYERLILPMDLMDLIVVYSGVSHRNVGGDYNQRRAECEEACEILGISLLREIDFASIERVKSLPNVQMRRARHVITENERVRLAAQAIQERDPERLGKLFGQSHDSMRDDYEVSIPEIDQLVKIFTDDPGVYGARLTGGGFGGSVVAISKRGESAAVLKRVLPKYQDATGATPRTLAGD